jgi:hypothetical protein
LAATADGSDDFVKNPDCNLHSVQAMRASWLLRETLASGASPFSVGEDGFHQLAAGLFMVGYDLAATEPQVM